MDCSNRYYLRRKQALAIEVTEGSSNEEDRIIKLDLPHIYGEISGW